MVGEQEQQQPPAGASLKGCLALASTLSAASALVAGLLGAAATIRFGPALAMGMAIYGGNTEPLTPAAPYPWGLYALGLLLFLGGITLDKFVPKHTILAHAIGHGGGLFTALIPFVHLWHLWERT